MNYKLAQKLKDAGYKFKKGIYSAFAVNEFLFELPTLEELINACGDRFESLVKVDNNKWVARGFNYGNFEKTPKEAVAKLWLELNK